MKYSRLSLTVTAILILAADNAAAERVYEVHKRFSGSSAPIAMDLNDDGLPAIRAIGGGLGGPVDPVQTPFRSRSYTERNPSEGQFTADNVSEGVLVVEPTGKCAVREFEFEIIHYSSVQRYSNGDLLVGLLKDGFTCFSLFTRRGYGIIRVNLVGGTGRFEGAQGEVVREFQALALDPTGLRSTFTAVTTGTLTLPD